MSGPGAACADNPYQLRPGGVPTADEPSASVEHLGARACWLLLADGELGRLAFMGEDGHPELFPVNYVVAHERVYLRSAPGSKLSGLAAAPNVAFEVDGAEDRSRWSVVIHGMAARLDADADIEASGVLELRSWSPTDKQNFIRITPTSISGRRFLRTDVLPAPHRTDSETSP